MKIKAHRPITRKAMEANKVFWFLVALCFCITAPSCGVLKKQFSKTVEQTDKTTETKEVKKQALIDTTKRDFSELITYQFTFEDFDFPDIQDREKQTDQPADSSIEQAINTQLAQLLKRVKTLDVTIQRTEKEELGVSKTEESESQQKEVDKSSSKEKNIDKDKDSTLAANIPWFAWIIGALLIFGIVVYLVKQFKPV